MALLRFGLLGLAVAGLLGGCGDTLHVPQVAAQTPLAAPTVTVHQTGSAPVVVDQTSVSFTLDAAGSLVVRARLRSQAPAAATVIVRASLFDAAGSQIGDASGGQIDVAPGTDTAIQINGPAPHGTISSATFEVTMAPAPTPT